MLPLFYFIGKVLSNKKDLINRIKTGILLTLCIYAILSLVLMLCTKQLLQLMSTDPSIVDACVTYIRIEVIATMFGILFKFTLVSLVTLGKNKLVNILTGINLALCVVLDIFLVSSLPVSANLGVNGIGATNIIVNGLLFFVTLLLLVKNGINIFNKDKMSFT